jgi:Tol biopolymer transport system component
MIAPVHYPMPAATQAESPAGLRIEAPAPRRKWLRWAAPAALLAGLAAAYWSIPSRSPEPAGGPIRFAIPPPAGFALEPAGTRQAFAVSPDGTRLAFTTLDADGSYALWLRELAALEPRRVRGADGVHNVFWSPDSASLYANIRGSIRRGSADGESFQLVCETPSGTISAGWLSPNQIILSARRASFVVPSSGGTPQPFAAERLLWAVKVPGTQDLAFIEYDRDRFRNRARVAPGGQMERIRDLLDSDSRISFVPRAANSDTGYALYVRAGSLLAQPVDEKALAPRGEPTVLANGVFTFHPTGAADFSVSNNGVLVYRRSPRKSQIIWVDRNGRKISEVTPPNITTKFAGLSPDATKIAATLYDVEHGETGVWLIDVASGASRRLTRDGVTESPIWSPDSKRIAFVRAAGHPPQLFVRGIGEHDPEEQVAPAPFQIATGWSPDGRYLAYTDTAFPTIDNVKEGDVWLVDMHRDRKAFPILNTKFRESTAIFSPDGNWLAFVADDSGRPEAYLQRFEGGDSPRLTGDRIQVSRSGATFLRWRPDGTELFYLGADSRIYAIPTALGQTLRAGEPGALFAVPLEARAVLPTMFAFDVSADGQRFLLPSTSGEPTPLEVVQNWESLVRR